MSGYMVRDFLSSPLRILALVLVAGALFLAIFADVITTYSPYSQDYDAVLEPPSSAHWLGTDHLGRDLLSRIIHGSRIAIVVGIAAVGFAVTVGSLLGLAAGYSRGILDEAIMRLVDAILAFPSVLLALGIMAALGPSLTTIIIAIAIGDMPVFARLTRSQVLSVRERDFVVAAQAMGARVPRIIFSHVWPHVTGPILAMATLHVGLAMLTEAGLSFLGLGVQPPTASWGAILRGGFGYIEVAPWISFFAGLAIFLTVLGLSLMGDAIRDLRDLRTAIS
ncbi:ABC transporter permease [Psychromarinibacter sp. C21-152]|uniref:ABC transporter permease n=1 Tax=Psychromarinibacter sediminicola TaxID=3033385 RepID=A0AAE3NNH1_9RHOB|nr:ABC transporter permease [Psychromarinibacter sediminicola]MDF0601233.1 ABC transporter permease [Psychromarinibacter sediminicola]